MHWRHAPVILSQSPEVIEKRASLYDKWFDDKWYINPSILTNDPETVITSVRALRVVDINLENTPPGPYFVLLSTTVANKRRKAAYIRRSILGHSQIRISPAKRSLSEIVRERAAQTTEDKETERMEIEEFKAFVRHLGAKGLGLDLPNIRQWAQPNNYPVSQEIFEPPQLTSSKRTKARLAPEKKPQSLKSPEPIATRTETRDGKDYVVYILPEKRRRTKRR